MWIERIAVPVMLASMGTAVPADYAHAPFHERAFQVADLALTVLDGDVTVNVPADDLPLTAAVAALLLLSEGGLAERYEEAVGERDAAAYAAAYDLLGTLRRWVGAVPADPEITALMAQLQALMPTAERPGRLDADPEAVEIVAQALVGQLERVTESDLYLGRDLARAMETVPQLAVQGCAADAETRPRRFDVAALYFEGNLQAPLSMMAPEQAVQIEEGFAALQAGDLSACATLERTFADAKRRLFP